MPTQLEGRVVLITGAKGGLGTFVTNAFLEAGARVAGVSRSIQDADFKNAAFAAFPAELSSAQAAQQVAGAVSARWGRVDALVHLMGGFAGGAATAPDAEEVAEKMFAANFWSAFHMARAVLPGMRDRRSGAILAIGSRAAVEPQAGLSAYSASKAALATFIRAVAAENKDLGITANLILPGTMDTPANRAAMPDADASRWIDPRQVASVLVHLASTEAAQVTGAAIPIYGREL